MRAVASHRIAEEPHGSFGSNSFNLVDQMAHDHIHASIVVKQLRPVRILERYDAGQVIALHAEAHQPRLVPTHTREKKYGWVIEVCRSLLGCKMNVALRQ